MPAGCSGSYEKGSIRNRSPPPCPSERLPAPCLVCRGRPYLRSCRCEWHPLMSARGPMLRITGFCPEGFEIMFARAAGSIRSFEVQGSVVWLKVVTVMVAGDHGEDGDQGAFYVFHMHISISMTKILKRSNPAAKIFGVCVYLVLFYRIFAENQLFTMKT